MKISTFNSFNGFSEKVYQQILGTLEKNAQF